MTERIDHATEAQKHIDWAHEQQSMEGQFDETVQHNATLAVAEATLALVEQQRIANLLTMAQFDHAIEDGVRLYTDLEWSAKLRQEAGERLGLS